MSLRRKIFLFVALPLIIIFGLVSYMMVSRGGNVQKVANKTTSSAKNPAVQAGIALSGGQCQGSGPGVLSHAAMDPGDYNYIIPYGLMVGGHVTPVDHQYYAVKRDSQRDAFPVYAVGDATIVDIQHRIQSSGDNQHVIDNPPNEYRLVFAQTCTFLYYYDLVTSLAPNIEAAFQKAAHGQLNAAVNFPVKAGDQIGRIGGQTLDFAVWNTEKPLSGFVVPAHYNNEAWKIYVADPLDYYTPELKTTMLARYPRVDEPLSGKLDWDIDGQLRGTWFLKGSNPGANNFDNPTPWSGELSLAPDLYDPSHFVISIGNYGETTPENGGTSNGVAAQQFYVKGNAPDPTTVSPASGLVKYELVTAGYVTPQGQNWDRESFVKGLKIKEDSTVRGVVLVQMVDNKTLKFEVFAGKTGTQVIGFDDQAKTYAR